MNQALSEFLKVLRSADVRVSTAEGIDAAQVLNVIGFNNRELLERSWSQVLAKSTVDKQRFHDCFRRFFERSEFAQLETDARDNNEHDADRSAATDTSAPQRASDLLSLLENGDRATLQIALTDAANEVGLEQIRLFTQRGLYIRRILDRMGAEVITDALIDAEASNDTARTAQLRQLRDRLREEVAALVERQMLLYTANAGERLREEVLRNVPLTRVEQRDFEALQRLVRKLARRLVSMHARRRKIARRGHLDVRHTLRRNIEYDGLLFETVWKRVKIDRPKIVAVCDVSGSVATVARFLLLFLYSLSEVIPNVRAFAFTYQAVEVSALFQEQALAEAIAQTLHHHGGQSSDYGRGLADLCAQILTAIDHRTTVIFLGDARSNHSDPGTRYLRQIQQRARRVLWLNPEPRTFWNTGDSEMRTLASACDRVEPCRSVQHLERIVSELLRHPC